MVADGGKAPDPLNDPLPNALKRETKERITTLVGMVKEKDSTLQAVTRDRDDLVDSIVATRATPEQYTQALSYLKMVNSPNRADREQALVVMQNEIAALARMLGKPVPGVNMLEGHQDLIDEVATGRLAPERAQEIAASRAAADHQLRVGQAQTNHERTESARAESVSKAKGELNAYGAQLAASDPNYKAKATILIKSLQPVFNQIHPSHWLDTFKRAYNELPAPARAVPPPATLSRTGATPANGGGNQPLRANQPAGAARPAPTSMAEAIELGISQAG